MSQPGQALEDVLPGRSRFEPVAIAASLAAVTAAALLCYALVASAEGWNRLLWSHEPEGMAVVVALLWVGFAVTGVVCGVIALALPNQRRVRPALALALGVLSLAAVPVVAAGSLWSWAGPHHPSDAKLMDDFRQHHPQFDQAIADYKATGSIARLRSLGVEADAVERDSSQGLITLPVSFWGMVPSGSAKGYAYSQAPLRPITEGETARYSGNMPDEIVYRHIEGPWYVYFESW